MKSLLKLCFFQFCLAALFVSVKTLAEDVTPNIQSSPTVAVGKPGITVTGIGIVALPAIPAPGPSNSPGGSGEKLQMSAVPLNPNVLRAYILADSEAEEKISAFCAGIRPYYVQGKSYQNENASGRLLLSLTVLGKILENGPMTEAEALGIPLEQSSNQNNPKEKLVVSDALDIAIADLNTLAKETLLDAPQLLLKPTPFIKFVRTHLAYLKKAQKQIVKSQF